MAVVHLVHLSTADMMELQLCFVCVCTSLKQCSTFMLRDVHTVHHSPGKSLLSMQSMSSMAAAWPMESTLFVQLSNMMECKFYFMRASLAKAKFDVHVAGCPYAPT